MVGIASGSPPLEEAEDENSGMRLLRRRRGYGFASLCLASLSFRGHGVLGVSCLDVGLFHHGVMSADRFGRRIGRFVCGWEIGGGA